MDEKHPLEELEERNSKSDVELARDGERDAVIRVLAGYCHDIYLRQRNPLLGHDAETEGYLVECFNRIRDGETPNDAFNWNRKKRGHPGLTTTELTDNMLIGSRVDDLVKAGHPEIRASGIVESESNNVSWQNAKKWYRHFFERD